MKIMFVNLARMVEDTGGLAKVACALSNAMAERGHEVSLLHADERDGKFFFPIDERVEVYNIKLDNGGNFIKMPAYLRVIREIFRLYWRQPASEVNSWFNEKYLVGNIQHLYNMIKPDVIVVHQPASTKILALDIKVKEPIVTLSHGDPADYFVNYPKAELVALPKSTVCQVLMKSYEKVLRDRYPGIRVETIGNAVPQFSVSADLSQEKQTYKILFVGALNKGRKRPHLLVEAFATLAKKYPDWQVEIWGKEDNKIYKKFLLDKITELKLTDSVKVMGPTQNVPSVLQSGDIFVFTSASEGFGMSLAEAMSMGLPVIGYRSCEAVNELIKDGKNGFLVGDGVPPLAEAMDKLMGSRDLRVELGRNARKDMAEYAPEVIWNKWDSLLRSLK